MDLYAFVKNLHVACAVLSLFGFSLRGYWMLMGSSLLQHKISKVLPHVVDTVLLSSAILLVLLSRQYPFLVDWISIKIGLLLCYIVVGSLALKRGGSIKSRRYFFMLSLMIISGIFYVALTKPVF